VLPPPHRVAPDGSPLDQANALKTYTRMGVPNIDRTTASVGNAQWRQAIGLTCIAGTPLRMIARPLAAQFETGPAAADALWERTTRDMRAGVRIMLHCNNHYVRVFGFRSGWHPAASLRPAREECFRGNEGGDSGDEEQAERVGTQRDAAASASLQAAAVWTGLAELNLTAAQLLLQHTVAAGEGAPDTLPPHPQRVHRREILTARRGQRAKHWVNWEQVACDVASHKIHCLLAVKPSGARGAQQQAPFLDVRGGTAHAPTANGS
jgi:hypothetical protein